MDDRLLAFKILSKIEHDKAYSNIVLDKVLNKYEATSSAFVCALVYGVLERKITLDYFLSRVLTQPIKKLNPQVLTILRLGVYQLKYMDRIPVSAAVNECVKLCRKVKCTFASGLVNSVLRKISSTVITLPNTDNKIYDLSIKYSCPESLVSQFIEDYGITYAEKILSESVGSVPTYIRVNTLKITPEELCQELFKEKIIAEVCKENSLSLEILSGSSIFKSKSYKKGYFHAQDLASQRCIDNFAPEKGDIVFDLCAAPGGKSFTIAEKMDNLGEIYAFDLYEHKIKLINDGAQRLGIDIIKADIGDASLYKEGLPKADKILCDVPCAGLGVIRKKPEIRYKKYSEVMGISGLQYKILCESSKYLKDDGILIYSTCSLNKDENENIINKTFDCIDFIIASLKIVILV